MDEGDVRLPIVVAKSTKESARSEVAHGGGGEGRLEAVEVVATRVDSGGGVPVIEWGNGVEAERARAAAKPAVEAAQHKAAGAAVARGWRRWLGLTMGMELRGWKGRTE